MACVSIVRDMRRMRSVCAVVVNKLQHSTYNKGAVLWISLPIARRMYDHTTYNISQPYGPAKPPQPHPSSMLLLAVTIHQFNQ